MTSPDPIVNDDVNKWYRKWRFAFRDSKYFKSSQLLWVEDLRFFKIGEIKWFFGFHCPPIPSDQELYHIGYVVSINEGPCRGRQSMKSQIIASQRLSNLLPTSANYFWLKFYYWFNLQDIPVRTITNYFRFRPFALSEVLLIIHGKSELFTSSINGCQGCLFNETKKDFLDPYRENKSQSFFILRGLVR